MILPPDTPPGWLSGYMGTARAAAILFAAALLGLAIGATERALRPDVSAGDLP